MRCYSTKHSFTFYNIHKVKEVLKSVLRQFSDRLYYGYVLVSCPLSKDMKPKKERKRRRKIQPQKDITNVHYHQSLSRHKALLQTLQC